MRDLTIAAGVVGAMTIAAVVLHVAAEGPSPSPSASGVVVVTGTGRAAPYPPNASPSPSLELATASELPPKGAVRRTTSFTASEREELSRMDGQMREEARDDAWASSNERRFTSRLQNMGIFSNAKTRVTCGATTCILSAQTDPNPSSYNVETALEALSRIGNGEAGAPSLQTNRVYSLKDERGQTVFKVELLRAE